MKILVLGLVVLLAVSVTAKTPPYDMHPKIDHGLYVVVTADNWTEVAQQQDVAIDGEYAHIYVVVERGYELDGSFGRVEKRLVGDDSRSYYNRTTGEKVVVRIAEPKDTLRGWFRLSRLLTLANHSEVLFMRPVQVRRTATTTAANVTEWTNATAENPTPGAPTSAKERTTRPTLRAPYVIGLTTAALVLIWYRLWTVKRT